ncbi:MAG TPA: anthranilate synthase component I family protein [Thermoanaerobaculia bacterium]|nr:anthranilate synthase component I family protein [Thermoanaerobaculia bacterium]
MALRALFNGDGWGLAAPLFLDGGEGRLQADTPEQLPAVLSSLDAVAASGDPGLIAAGFISYEAGVLLEGSRELFRDPDGAPLSAFGLWRLRDAAGRAPAPGDAAFPFRDLRRATAQPSLSPEAWSRGVGTIRDGIARGDVYQVNLTRRTRIRASADPVALAEALFRENPVPYAMTLAGEGWAVVSNSPELFLDADLDAGRAASGPIKGTVARGGSAAEDAAARSWLLGSAKDAAEHVMIVDLIRNDLGRVAEPGGVRVERLGTLRTFRHLHHLESLVAARLAPGVRVSDLLRATLPGGSVTGAPKRSALGFIRRVEPCARGAYTGAAGYVRGNGRVVLNVAIRTAIVHGGVVDYHAGGGIVWDSDAAREWAEAETKSKEFEALLRDGRTAPGGESGR